MKIKLFILFGKEVVRGMKIDFLFVLLAFFEIELDLV